MKKKLMKNIALALAFAVVFSLAGCGHSERAASSTEPESSGSELATVPGGSEDGEDVSPAEAEAEGDESTASVGSDENSGASEAAAPEQVSSESQAASGEQAIPGTDLNVLFGDDGGPFTLHLYDNETADAIARHVGTADWRLPIYHYDDYEGWEVMQYYDIPSRYEIPSNPQSVTSVKAGEVYYSEPNRIILFYGDAEISNEYTPVGYIDASEEFVDAVESNPVIEGWGNKIVNISK